MRIYGSQRGSLAAACSYTKPYFYYKSCGNLYQYYKPHKNQYKVQVTCAVSKRAMKLKIRMIKSFSPQYHAIQENAIGIVTCAVHA